MSGVVGDGIQLIAFSLIRDLLGKRGAEVVSLSCNRLKYPMIPPKIQQTSLVFVLSGLLLLMVPAGCTTPPPRNSPSEYPYDLNQVQKPDQIFHVSTGHRIDFQELLDVLEEDRVVYVGESHTNVHAHRIQKKILKGLYNRNPDRVIIGMEMFREPQQNVLDQWSQGELTVDQFLKTSSWEKNWGFPFEYYRGILTFARDKNLPIVALNPSRKLENEVRKASPNENLPPELQKRLPEMPSSGPYQKQFLRKKFSRHIKTGRGMKKFFRIQKLWEENMAGNIEETLHTNQQKPVQMIVFAGKGHLKYGFGIPRNVFRRTPTSYSIVLPKIIDQKEPEGGREKNQHNNQRQQRESRIPLLPADYLWTIPYEELDGEEQ